MKKNIIIIVSILLVLLLILVPHINAVQYKTIELTLEDEVQQIIHINLEKFSNLSFGDGFFKKLLTNSVFGIQSMLALGY
jgi:hypothetical protein